MLTIFRCSPMEIALLNKLNNLPVSPRKKQRIRQFDFSNAAILCWYHGISRKGRRYSLQCDVREDGELEVSCRPVLNGSRSFRMPKTKHFPGQLRS